MARQSKVMQAARAGDRLKAPSAARRAPKVRSRFREYADAIVIAVLMALFVRQFVIQAFRIPSGSMESTLLIGDFLFVNKFLYGAQVPWTDLRLPAVREPRRGDIIVFKSWRDGRDFIKRCVAVAGDTVLVRGNRLYVNGELQDEAYAQYLSGGIQYQSGPYATSSPYVVPEGHLFMMGDNRDNSQDSRYHGPLPMQNVKGKAMFIYFSVADWFPPSIRFSRIGDILH